MESVKELKEKVHDLYWDKQGSCAHVMLLCLGELLQVKLESQVFACTAGLHAAEKWGAQCGLAVAGQMFIGIFYRQCGKDDATVVSYCTQYAEAFRNKFGALGCSDLRLSGYMSTDPRHVCEQLTCDAVTITYNFLKKDNGLS